MSEQDYRRGKRSVWLSLLENALRQLGYDNPDAQHTSWIAERERAIAVLREVCATHGDNDWPDNLELSDVIDKHLARHLG